MRFCRRLLLYSRSYTMTADEKRFVLYKRSRNGRGAMSEFNRQRPMRIWVRFHRSTKSPWGAFGPFPSGKECLSTGFLTNWPAGTRRNLRGEMSKKKKKCLQLNPATSDNNGVILEKYHCRRGPEVVDFDGILFVMCPKTV